MSEKTTNNTITLKAYGDAKISEPAPTPTIEPSGAVTLTPTKNSDGSITYKIAKGSIAANTSCTIDFGDGTKPFEFTYVAEEVTVDVDGKDVVTGIEPNKETVIDLSTVIGEDEELATITAGDKVIYDVNDPEKTVDGYEYDPDDKTLTVPAGVEDKLTINAEKVKVLLFDALLTTNGRNYTRPTLNADNLKGKYSKPSEAYAAVSDLKFNRGIYIQLQSDINQDYFYSLFPQQSITFDLNGKKWSGEKVKKRLIQVDSNTSEISISVINGILCDNSMVEDSDQLGSAIFINNKSDSNNYTIDDWYNGNRDQWLAVNVHDVTFSSNYADCGGAICLNGKTEFNIYNSIFEKNKSKDTSNPDDTGTGAAIIYWNKNLESQGEIVNLYDCNFSENDGINLFSMEREKNQKVDVLLNIYGGKFTGNTLHDSPLSSIQAFNVYGGDFSNETLSNDSGNNNKMVINGGIMGTLDIKGDNPLTLAGGSVGTLNTDKNTDKKLASVTLVGTAKKVEYVTYDGGTVNINSPFKIDRNGAVHYKYESGYDRISGDEFNGSEFNPAIKTFNVFLPSAQIDSIKSITVHFADGSPVTLSKTETTEGSVEFK